MTTDERDAYLHAARAVRLRRLTDSVAVCVCGHMHNGKNPCGEYIDGVIWCSCQKFVPTLTTADHD